MSSSPKRLTIPTGGIMAANLLPARAPATEPRAIQSPGLTYTFWWRW